MNIEVRGHTLRKLVAMREMQAKLHACLYSAPHLSASVRILTTIIFRGAQIYTAPHSGSDHFFERNGTPLFSLELQQPGFAASSTIPACREPNVGVPSSSLPHGPKS
jgi:hypothetical protein